MGQPLETRIRTLQDHYWSEADPEGRAFVPLADAFRQAGDFQEAARILRDGLRRHPSLASGHLVAAWAAVDQGHVEAAEDAFRKVLAIDPRNTAALRGLGKILLERRDLASALDLFQRLLQEDPLDGELPVQVQALRETIRTMDQTDLPVESVPDFPPSTLWDDPDQVVQELDWETAAIQGDRSREKKADGPSQEAPSDTEPQAWDAGAGLPSRRADLREDTLVTPTLGEIYLRQGLLDWAEGVFEVLVDRDPHNEYLKNRLDEIRSRRRGGGWAEEGSPEAVLQEIPKAGDRVLPIEALAPDAVVPVETLAPESGVSGESLAPDAVVPVEILAPDSVIPIEALAPDSVVPIEALAPDAVVSVETLAPDAVVPVEALAPESGEPGAAPVPDAVIPIEALAPDRVGPVKSPAPDTVVPIESLAPDRFGDPGSGVERGPGPVDRPQ